MSYHIETRRLTQSLMIDPRDAEMWEWDENNEAELARHRVRPAEVEEVFEARPVVLPNRRGRSGSFKLVGRSAGGRALTIIVSYDSIRRSLRAITGYDAPGADQNRYLHE